MLKLVKICAIAFSLFIAACQTAEMVMEEKGVSPLTGEELMQLVSGNTVYGSDQYGAPWAEYMASNGNAYFKYHRRYIKIGHWEVKGNEICFLYSDSKSDVPFCFHYYVDGDSHRTIFTTTSKKGKWGDTIHRYQEGDVENLM